MEATPPRFGDNTQASSETADERSRQGGDNQGGEENSKVNYLLTG